MARHGNSVVEQQRDSGIVTSYQKCPPRFSKKVSQLRASSHAMKPIGRVITSADRSSLSARAKELVRGRGHGQCRLHVLDPQAGNLSKKRPMNHEQHMCTLYMVAGRVGLIKMLS